MSMSEAIQILQQHERSRQGRLRASFMKLFQEREARRLRVMRKGTEHTAYAGLKMYLKEPQISLKTKQQPLLLQAGAGTWREK